MLLRSKLQHSIGKLQCINLLYTNIQNAGIKNLIIAEHILQVARKFLNKVAQFKATVASAKQEETLVYWRTVSTDDSVVWLYTKSCFVLSLCYCYNVTDCTNISLPQCKRLVLDIFSMYRRYFPQEEWIELTNICWSQRTIWIKLHWCNEIQHVVTNVASIDDRRPLKPIRCVEFRNKQRQWLESLDTMWHIGKHCLTYCHDILSYHIEYIDTSVYGK